MPGAMVVGVGGAGSGYAAARTAARLAGMMNVPLVLVFGYEPVALGPRGGALEDEIAAVGKHAIAVIHDELKGLLPDLVIEVELVDERPVDAMINIASTRHAELIAVGHGGGGPLRGALLGSITYEIVHRAPLPVLVVPNDPGDE